MRASRHDGMQMRVDMHESTFAQTLHPTPYSISEISFAEVAPRPRPRPRPLHALLPRPLEAPCHAPLPQPLEEPTASGATCCPPGTSVPVGFTMAAVGTTTNPLTAATTEPCAAG